VTLDAAASSPARLRIVRFYDISAEICDRCSAAARLWISRKKVPPPPPFSPVHSSFTSEVFLQLGRGAATLLPLLPVKI